jgi:RHS repeat-associated protein
VHCHRNSVILISASGAGNTASYAYDAQGRRKSKTVNGTTTIFVQDPQARALLDYDGTSGTIQNWYAFGAGANDALNQMNLVTSTRASYLPDIQGSVIASIDASSGTVTKTGYQTYGESNTTAGIFRYTGARIDAETNGLYNFRARMYSPTLGRFMQADPIGYLGGINLYAYVGNDPLDLTDPLGQFGFLVSFGGQIGVGLSSIFAQAGGQGSASVAILVDTSQLSLSNPTAIGISIVTFNTVGSTAGALGSNPPVYDPTNPIGTLSQSGVIVGAYAGGGFSFGVTNANNASDLANLSGTVNVNAGLGLGFGGQLSKSSSGTVTLSVSPPGFGIGEGLEASGYPTNTTVMTNTTVVTNK